MTKTAYKTLVYHPRSCSGVKNDLARKKKEKEVLYDRNKVVGVSDFTTVTKTNY